MNNLRTKVEFTETEDDYGKRIYGKVLGGVDGKYQGGIGYSPTNCEITRLFVSKAFRNQGIGTQLFHMAVSMMPHCSEITVRAHKDSVNFYRKQGMSISKVDPLRHYLEPGDNTVHMFGKK